MTKPESPGGPVGLIIHNSTSVQMENCKFLNLDRFEIAGTGDVAFKKVLVAHTATPAKHDHWPMIGAVVAMFRTALEAVKKSVGG